MTNIAMDEATFRLADVFRKAIAVYFRRFVPFVILTVIATIPNYVAILAIPTPVLRGTPDLDSLAAFGYAMGALFLVTIVTTSLASAAVIYGVVQDLRGRAFSVADSLLVALRRLLPILGVAFCVAIPVLLGMLLLLVPGIMLFCMYFVSTHACVVERTGVFASMSRSRFLTRGHRWQLFGVLLLVVIAAIILSAIVQAIFTPTGTYGVLIASQLSNAIIAAFNGVLFSVFYFQLRVTKEGVDIDKIASVFD